MHCDVCLLMFYVRSFFYQEFLFFTIVIVFKMYCFFKGESKTNIGYKKNMFICFN